MLKTLPIVACIPNNWIDKTLIEATHGARRDVHMLRDTSLRRRVHHYIELFRRPQPPQIDIQSVYRHCFPINPYWELAHAPICRHQNAICLWKFIVFAITVDSFPLATPRNEITLFNSLFAYITRCVLEGNIAGFVCTCESRLGRVFSSY